MAAHNVELLGDHSFALASLLKSLVPLPEAKKERLSGVSARLVDLHDMATSYFLGAKGTS